jgi:hypothetical protein
MALLTELEVRARAAMLTEPLRKSAGKLLMEDRAGLQAEFDVFLSHSSAEPEEILLGIKGFLRDYGLSVYVDKYSDPDLSPEDVTAKTAEILRMRRRQSKSLLYVYSCHSVKSRWMPWELGFFDGYSGRIGIVPVTQRQEETFKGEEYLNLYPYVDRETIRGTTIHNFWINRKPNEYAELAKWARGLESIGLHT